MTAPDGTALRAERVRLFSNGSEYIEWARFNCDECERVGCALRDAIAVAYWSDGTAPRDVAERLGRLSDDADARCSERMPSARVKAYDDHRATLPRWRIRRASDGFTPVDGARLSVAEARQAVRNWNDPFPVYTISRIPSLLGGSANG